MRWFGESWGARICDESQHCLTPDGEVCPQCSRTIRLGDQGFELPYYHHDEEADTHAYHRRCLLAALGVEEKEAPLVQAAARKAFEGAAQRVFSEHAQLFEQLAESERLEKDSGPGSTPNPNPSTSDAAGARATPICPACGTLRDWRIAAGCPKCDYEDK